MSKSRNNSQNTIINLNQCSNSFDDVTWNVIQKYFEDNPQILVQHHIDSYNEFVERGIRNIIDKSPFKRFTILPENANNNSTDRKSTRLNSSHSSVSRMPSSA